MHRVLTRNGLIDAQAQQHRRKYKRWQRQTPMNLWQLDIVGGVPLADGRECKLVTGIDDHSRFVVAATVVPAPSGRAVSEACTVAAGVAPGRYQILAAINAVRTSARDIRDTDWSQIVALYDQLVSLDPSPIIALNRAVAVAELRGPQVALAPEAKVHRGEG